MIRAVVGFAIAFLLCGCATNGPKLIQAKYDAYAGTVPDLTPADVGVFRKNNDKADFTNLAGVNVPGPNDEWRPIIDAGVSYIDTRCERFMDALFWPNRTRKTASRQIRGTGSAVAQR